MNQPANKRKRAMHLKTFGTALASIVLTGSFAFAQPPQTAEPILLQGFENGTGEWRSIGGQAKVGVADDPENVKTGQRALRFDYTVQAGQFEALINPLATATFASLKSIKFWIKTSHSTTFLLALQEQGGGRFATVFSIAKDTWQNVEIDPAELILQDGADDPKDANGQLDLEKTEFIGLIDFDQVLIQMVGGAPNPIAQMIHIPFGPRTLYLDEVTFSSRPLPESKATPDAYDIDLFQRPQAQWASIGGATLERMEAKDAKDNALRVTYPQAPGHITALLKPLRPGALAGKKQLSFQVASMKPTTLLLQLEETGGGKYNAPIEVPGNATPKTITLNFSDFKTSPDSNDNNDRLDLDQVKQLLIVDATSLMGGMPEGAPGGIPLDLPEGQPGSENTLWLNALRAK
jgi:hypothetical protein